MKQRGVHLHYTYQVDSQRGAVVHNALFELLKAVHEHGSIQRAATAIGVSYRHVWGSLKHWQDVLGIELVGWSQGHPARLTPFAERLLGAETHARARLAPHIEALRAELERVLAEALDGTQLLLRLHASHDPALALLREGARDGQRLHIELRAAGSIDALRALEGGRCGVAGLHVPLLAEDADRLVRRLKPLLDPGRHQLIGFARRTQGLMVPAGNPLELQSLADVVNRQARYAQRQPGSCTRLLAEQLVRQQKVDPRRLVVACTEDSPAAVAAAVARGLADAGIGIEAAALDHGLGFVPLATERCFLLCAADAVERPAVQALRRALHDPSWQRAVAALPGYALDRAGELLSLADELPWSILRKTKPAG